MSWDPGYSVPTPNEGDGGDGSPGGGAVDSVDGRTGVVTLVDLYDQAGAAAAVGSDLADLEAALPGTYQPLGVGGTLHTISPSADAYINQQLATTNFGTTTTLWMGEKFDSSGSFGRIALFAFDISSLTGLNVASAMMRVTRDEGSPSLALTTANRLVARRVKRAFVSSQVTWNAYSTGNNWATAGARGGDDVETLTYTAAIVVGDRDQDVWMCDLTEMVKDALTAGDTTLRFLLGWATATAGQNTVQIASQDNATAAKRPLLTVITI